MRSRAAGAGAVVAETDVVGIVDVEGTGSTGTAAIGVDAVGSTGRWAATVTMSPDLAVGRSTAEAG